MKRFLEFFLLGAGCSLLATGCSLPSDVMFRSAESHTATGGDVYNRVHFVRDGSRDVWMMNQSHDGGRTFERLAIVVDGKQASFYQLEAGALEWRATDGAAGAPAQREYRVACALCHANGPRAIRPNGTLEGDLTFAERLRVSLWNLRIKMYPRLHSDAAPGFDHKIPFRFAGTFANSPLKVATCAYCHREDGPVARGTLVRQNALTIASMVDRGEMPPLGIPLPAAQKRELDRFLKGL